MLTSIKGLNMLVLSRKPNETIVLNCRGVRIEVTVAVILGDKVRIGITAPREVTVHREEVQERIDAEEK
jgi:carbon storage regulator CsrA